MALAFAAATLVLANGAYAVIGGAASKHNMTEVPGYGFGGDVCAACHKTHFTSGEKRLWTSDKNAAGDGLRTLAPAKAASLDQVAGPGDYPGIYLCLDCHGGTASTPAWADVAGHKAAKVATHSTREMQATGYIPKYTSFVMQCTDCHDNHQSWNGVFQPGQNGYMLRSSIKTPNSGTWKVVFTGMTGQGSLGPGTPPYQAICQVCHTATSFNRNNGGAAHHNGENCTTCHPHNGGFSAGSTSCGNCHGDPPVSYNTLVGRPANPGSTPTGAATAGTHAFHAMSTAGGSGYACAVCHNGGMRIGVLNNKVIDVKFSAFGVSTSGSFDGFAPISGYTFSAGNTTGGTLRCSNTYCHGNFAKGGIVTNKPVWSDPATGACGTCHPVAPPALSNHSVHISAAWGPKASCDDCHPAGSANGRGASHVNGVFELKDGKTLANTDICNGCHGCTAGTKPTWGDTSRRADTSWCEGCHNGSSVVNTVAGTGGVSVTAPNVVGDRVTYGYDVTGHGKPSAGKQCTDCHDRLTVHIDGKSPTYKSSSGNFKAGYRLTISNDVPLLGSYAAAKYSLCYNCHEEARVVGMPAEGKQSTNHVNATPISTGAGGGWYTNFRNMSTTLGIDNGGYYDMRNMPYHDVPTNIHWNHLDDFGSTNSGKIFDSDNDGLGDSYVTCETCHNPHGTHYPAMTLDDFSLQTFSALSNQSLSYRWLGSSQYTTTRCTEFCHTSGDAPASLGGTRWYRSPASTGSMFGVPLGLAAQPLQ